MKTVKAPTSDIWIDSLIDSLKDPQEAAAYLEAVLESEAGDSELLSVALQDVLKALGESQLSSEETQHRLEKIDDILSQPGSEAIYELAQWLKPLGLQLTVTIAEFE